MKPVRHSLAGVAIAVVLAAAVRPASAESWIASSEPPAKVGLSDGSHYYGLWFRCVAPGRMEIILDDGEGVHRIGSRQTVSVVASKRTTRFKGVVSANEMEETAMIIASEDLRDAERFLTSLADGESAQIVWPKSRYEIPLVGAAAAIKRFTQSCAR